MNIKKDDVVLDTKFILEIRELKGDYQLIKSDVVEFISEVYNNSRLRVFIKPNGNYGATCQLVYPNSYTEINIKKLLPERLYNELGKQLFITNLKSTKYYVPNNNRIILLGDSLNGMIPYHGSGANTAIINSHHLAEIIKHNTYSSENIAKEYYDKIKDYTFRLVSESLNTFLEIHNPNFGKENNTELKIYTYCDNILITPISPNYRLNDIPIIFKNNFTEIILAGANIKEFPKEFTLLDNLKILNLNDNLIDYIPESIRLLINLKELYLINNNITIFPSELNQLINLEIIRLSYNNIKSIDINLPKLRELCLTGNQLEEITSLNLCKKLEKIYMSENNIKNLQDLHSLNKIKYFRISFNPIKYDLILNLLSSSQLKNIIEIKISHCQLDTTKLTDIKLPKYIEIKYGSTLSKSNRKYFDPIQFTNVKSLSSDINTIKFEIYTKIAQVLTKSILHNNDIISFIIKLNLLKLDFEIEPIKKDESINIIKSKINQIVNSNKKNIVEILRIFTIYSIVLFNIYIVSFFNFIKYR